MPNSKYCEFTEPPSLVDNLLVEHPNGPTSTPLVGRPRVPSRGAAPKATKRSKAPKSQKPIILPIKDPTCKSRITSDDPNPHIPMLGPRLLPQNIPPNKHIPTPSVLLTLTLALLITPASANSDNNGILILSPGSPPPPAPPSPPSTPPLPPPPPPSSPRSYFPDGVRGVRAPKRRLDQVGERE